MKVVELPCRKECWCMPPIDGGAEDNFNGFLCDHTPLQVMDVLFFFYFYFFQDAL